MNFIICLPSCLSCGIFNQWLELKDVGRLDSAFCVGSLRPLLLDLLMSTECVIETKMNSSDGRFIDWLLERAVKLRNFDISMDINEELGVQYMKKHGSSVATVSRNGFFSHGQQLQNFGMEIFKQALDHGRLVCVQCEDTSVLFLCEVLLRGQSLRELNIHLASPVGRAQAVTQCAPLRSLTDLRLAGDAKLFGDVISLCPNLKRLDATCYHVHRNDSLISTIQKCRRLCVLGVRGLTFSAPAFIAMATRCTDIVNLDLYLTTVTDEVIESIAVNMKHLRRLNLQYCRLLTSSSLRSLAIHRASSLKVLWLWDNPKITSNAVLALKNAAPTLYVHYRLCVDLARELDASSSDYAVCTVLYLQKPKRNLLSIAYECTLLTVLCVDGGIPHAANITTTAVAKLIHCCPHLHTMIVDCRDLSRVRRVVASVAEYITVTSSTSCLFVDLYDVPL